jgi:hypothetical protein
MRRSLRFIGWTALLSFSVMGMAAPSNNGPYYASNEQVVQSALDAAYAQNPQATRQMSQSDFDGVVTCAYRDQGLGVRYSHTDLAATGLSSDFTSAAQSAVRRCTQQLVTRKVPVLDSVSAFNAEQSR